MTGASLNLAVSLLDAPSVLEDPAQVAGLLAIGTGLLAIGQLVFWGLAGGLAARWESCGLPG